MLGRDSGRAAWEIFSPLFLHQATALATVFPQAQRGGCPHIWYVAALHGEIDLRAVPTRGKPGRKRAATRTVLLPNGHADEMNRARQGKGLNLHRQRGLGKAIP